MVEQRIPTAPGGAPAPHDDILLATKLRLPRQRPGAVPRSRLAHRLTEATARELTLVCAPAGFGKTTLVADWARAARRPLAWLSLDGDDNDVVRFWRYVAAALEDLHGGIGGSSPGCWTGHGRSTPRWSRPRWSTRWQRCPRWPCWCSTTTT